MKLKKILVITSLIVTLAPIALFSANTDTVYASETENIQETPADITYEESLNLPYADLSADLNSNNRGITLFSTKNPSSVTDYKNLGYKNIEYTAWTGYKKVASTKSKRIATYVVTNVLGFIPSTYVRTAIGIYDLTSTLQTQNPDVWPTVNTRNILATSPRGTEVIIGQQTIVKYYGNSARTKLIKTINKTFYLQIS